MKWLLVLSAVLVAVNAQDTCYADSVNGCNGLGNGTYYFINNRKFFPKKQNIFFQVRMEIHICTQLSVNKKKMVLTMRIISFF